MARAALPLSRILLAALLLTAPGTVQAAEGMPQLNFGNPLTLSQIAWLAVIFVGLYAVLSRWALPQVDAVLEKRASVIASDLDAARLAKAESDAAVSELIRTTRESQAQAAAQVAEAIARAKEAAARSDAVQKQSIDARLKEAEDRIEATRRSAMGALHQVALDTATAVVSRLTEHPAEPARLEAEVSAALAARAGA